MLLLLLRVHYVIQALLLTADKVNEGGRLRRAMSSIHRRRLLRVMVHLQASFVSICTFVIVKQVVSVFVLLSAVSASHAAPAGQLPAAAAGS